MFLCIVLLIYYTCDVNKYVQIDSGTYICYVFGFALKSGCDINTQATLLLACYERKTIDSMHRLSALHYDLYCFARVTDA
jgi:hypothetical protein